MTAESTTAKFFGGPFDGEEIQLQNPPAKQLSPPYMDRPEKYFFDFGAGEYVWHQIWTQRNV